ncbi:MAG TPA: hypothetical protein PL137_13340 [Nocardioides sp.]|nr:hypothetical protein [Nocardioides sp.]
MATGINTVATAVHAATSRPYVARQTGLTTMAIVPRQANGSSTTTACTTSG